MTDSGRAGRDPATEATLHRALGLTDDEAARIAEILGRPPNHLELAMYAVMWSEHCSYKSSRRHLRPPAHRGPPGPGGTGGERRRRRRRRRDRRGPADREPQPPLGGRALPGGGHRCGRDPPRHLHHGGPAHRPDGPAVLRPPRRRPRPVAGRGGGGRHLRLRQRRRRPHRRRRAHLLALLRPQPARERALPGGAPARAPRPLRAPTARGTWPSSSGPPPGATASAG